MNLTDVDDRTIAAAGGRGVSLRAHVDPFARAFEEDRDWLRIVPAHAQPRATEFVPAMIRADRGAAGQGRGLPGRGRLGLLRHRPVSRTTAGCRRLDRRELRAGASERVSARRVRQGGRPRFRAVEGRRAEDEAVGAAWDAPFGRGRPGWHLECSAMALELLGGTGTPTSRHPCRRRGPDLPPPRGRDRPELRVHRAGGVRPHWVHGEFLRIDGTKMSKRYGNILTVRDLREQAVEPAAVRLLLFGTHYRQLLEWSDEALAAAREGSARLGAFRDRLERAAGDADARPPRPWPTGSGWTSPRRWTTTSTRPAPSPRCSSWSGRAIGCWMRASRPDRR